MLLKKNEKLVICEINKRYKQLLIFQGQCGWWLAHRTMQVAVGTVTSKITAAANGDRRKRKKNWKKIINGEYTRGYFRETDKLNQL